MCLEAVGLGFGQVCAGTVVVGLEGCWVDAEQYIAFFHIAAFAEYLLQDYAGYPCADFGDAGGENAAVQFGADGDGLYLDRFDFDLAGGWLLLGGGF
ncbi:hypothetical protein D3C76_1136150 [compost metagenome]